MSYVIWRVEWRRDGGEWEPMKWLPGSTTDEGRCREVVEQVRAGGWGQGMEARLLRRVIVNYSSPWHMVE